MSNHYWCLLILIPVGWNYMFINSIYHAYDIPSLFFFCTCLYLFLNKKYILFYIVFAIATLNRESTCFITISVVLLLFEFKFDDSLKDNILSNSCLIKHLLAQATLWLSVVLLIRWFLKDSLGQTYESTYSMNVFIANMWNGLPSWPFLNTENFFENPRCFLTLFGCVWVIIPFCGNIFKRIAKTSVTHSYLHDPCIFICKLNGNKSLSRIKCDYLFSCNIGSYTT